MNTGSRSKPNILLVDDSPNNLATLSRMLSDQGYYVRQAINGNVALTAARTVLPDLILLDIRMPGLDGYEVCHQLKADENTRNIPILFLSALDDPDDKVKAFEVGGVDYITKPFQGEEVLARVRTHLAVQQLQQHLEDANRVLEVRIQEKTEDLRLANTQLLREIEEHKQTAEQLRTLNDELELRVKQRTAELEASNQELRDFAYIVSHDLKAPLRGITNLALWLVEDYAPRLDAQGQEICTLLRSRVARLNDMIDAILRYSRAGHITGDDILIDLNRLLNDVVTMLSPPSHIQIHVAPDLPKIVANQTRIEQIFQNLLQNAIKFMDKPQGEITISYATDADFLIFRVADNGPGIAVSDQQRIFQIFQTGSARNAGECSGVGLTIAKKLVEGYGGVIWVESTPGAGSTFIFTLPQTLQAAVDRAKQGEPIFETTTSGSRIARRQDESDLGLNDSPICVSN